MRAVLCFAALVLLAVGAFAVPIPGCYDNVPDARHCDLPKDDSRLDGNYAACQAINNPDDTVILPTEDTAANFSQGTPNYMMCNCPDKKCWQAYTALQCSKQCKVCTGNPETNQFSSAPVVCKSACERVKEACTEYNKFARPLCRIEPSPGDCANRDTNCRLIDSFPHQPFTCAASALPILINSLF